MIPFTIGQLSVVPKDPRQRDLLTLARLLESEDRRPAIRVVLGWFAMEAAARRGLSVYRRVTGRSGLWGPQRYLNETRYASTEQAPSPESLQLAEHLLAGSVLPSREIRRHGVSAWIEEGVGGYDSKRVLAKQESYGGIWGRITGTRWFLYDPKAPPVRSLERVPEVPAVDERPLVATVEQQPLLALLARARTPAANSSGDVPVLTMGALTGALGSVGSGQPVVVLDPGHGGTGQVRGSSGNNARGLLGTLEKDLALRLAQRIRTQLEAQGLAVRLTRETDRNLGLSERLLFGRRAGAAVFLSLHFNGDVRPEIQGSETWVAQRASAASLRFGRRLQRALVDATGLRNRGVKRKNLEVLYGFFHDPQIAAALVEVSYLSDPREEARLLEEPYLNRIAAYLCDAVVDELRAQGWAGGAFARANDLSAATLGALSGGLGGILGGGNAGIVPPIPIPQLDRRSSSKPNRPFHLATSRVRLKRWPVKTRRIERIGQSTLADRGNGQPHFGVDIYVPSGSGVYSPVRGGVVRVIDGRGSSNGSRRRAGLWIDIRGRKGLLYRFLHLGEALVEKNDSVRPGQLIGRVAEPNTSGLGKSGPHLHFEVRLDPDETYGDPVDPLSMLPALPVRRTS